MAALHRLDIEVFNSGVFSAADEQEDFEELLSNLQNIRVLQVSIRGCVLNATTCAYMITCGCCMMGVLGGWACHSLYYIGDSAINVCFLLNEQRWESRRQHIMQ